jgi:type I restriction enzyme R subunit
MSSPFGGGRRSAPEGPGGASLRLRVGQEIEDRIYNQRDMDRVLVLNERTKRVAERIVSYLVGTDPYGKTI